MPNKNRLVRINDEIMREVAEIIRSECKDPRIASLCAVTKVDTTNDLKLCKIYVSILGSSEEKQGVMEGLKNASGFIRKELAARINLRNTPELKFVLDEDLEINQRMSKIIDEVIKNDRRES